MLAVYDADTEYSTGRTSPRTVTNVLAARDMMMLWFMVISILIPAMTGKCAAVISCL